MFKIQRFADCGGIKKQWLHRSASGTIAYMCPKCYNILYANGKYDFNIKTNIDFYVDMVFGYNCPNCEIVKIGDYWFADCDNVELNSIFYYLI